MIAAASRRIITLSETLLTQNKRKDRKYFKEMTTLTISAVFADAVNVRKGSTKAGGENVDQIFSFSPPKAGIVSSGTPGRGGAALFMRSYAAVAISVRGKRHREMDQLMIATSLHTFQTKKNRAAYAVVLSLGLGL